MNLFLKLGLDCMHGLSFLIWDVSIMGHWDTLVLLNSCLWASDVDRTTSVKNSLGVDSLLTSPLVT